MGASSGPTAPDRTGRRRPKRRTVRSRIVVGVALVIAFVVGIALGQALHDNPRPGGEQTSFRTFPPLTTSTSR
jgi:hypothetical protein